MNKRLGRVRLVIVTYNVFLKNWFRRKLSELFTTLRDILSKLEAVKVAYHTYPAIITLSYRASQSLLKCKGTQTRNLRI